MRFRVLTLWCGCGDRAVGCEDRCLDTEAHVAKQAVEADSSPKFDPAACEQRCADSRGLGCGNAFQGVRTCKQKEADELLDQCAQECEAYLL